VKVRILSLCISVFAMLALALSFAVARGQDSTASPQSGQGQGPGYGNAQRSGRGGFGAMMGRGVMGTVTEVAADHYTIKTEAGDLYTVHYGVNTRFMKGGPQRRGQRDEPPANPPQSIKATDIKVGDAIGASGEIEENAKSVGAVVIFQIDPERAKQMREMQANYGKTWLMGKVTAVNDLRVTILGGPDNVARTFAADENTTFRKHREPITLADLQVGDIVRVEGASKDGGFLASTVAVMGPRQHDSNPAPAAQTQ
jgi:preprotein translocase subunit YajC